jgi:hypothetical protein
MSYYQALKDYLVRNPLIKKSLRGEPIQSISPSTLPAQYNNVPFDGARVVNGKFCHTVGEYKAACAKLYGPECSE